VQAKNPCQDNNHDYYQNSYFNKKLRQWAKFLFLCYGGYSFFSALFCSFFFFFCRREVSSAGFPEYQEFQFLSVEFLTPSFLALEFRQAGKCIASIFKILLLSQPSHREQSSRVAEAVAPSGAAEKLN